MLFTYAEFIAEFPEYAEITEPQFNFYYCLVTAMFKDFCGLDTDALRICAAKLAVAHVGALACDGTLGGPVKEVKTMNSTTKIHTQDYDPTTLSLVQTNYGRMLLDIANQCVGLTFLATQWGCPNAYWT
jgi:hypothetical protein